MINVIIIITIIIIVIIRFLYCFPPDFVNHIHMKRE